MFKLHMKRMLLLPIVVPFLAAPSAFASPPTPSVEEANDECVSCHGNEDMTITLADGKEASIAVKAELLTASVHAKLRCVECHAENAEVPHPERTFKDAAAFRASFEDTCNKCHAENHKKMMDGVHSKLAAKVDRALPTCISCHGSHDVRHPAEPRVRIAETCASCHKDLVAQYANSVHGQALAKGNPDVPTCTSCHNPHDMADPRERAWLLSSPQQCGKCHADDKMMAKYNLSTAVMSTYLNDFHGVTASFGVSAKGKADDRRVALCGDCHGVHDTARATGANAAVLRAGLVETCRKCHAGASTNLPSAWLGHQEASLTSAPVVFSVKVFYLFIIPSILGGLILQIILHFRRSVAKR